jgi:CRP-like cAMP-binding protein
MDNGGDTSVISLGDIASPIASLLDEAVAGLDAPDASAPSSVAKRPLSFLPQRAAESESIAARLSALPMFSELPKDQLRALSRQLITESRQADEHLCESGAPEGPLYVVLSGSAWVGLAGRASPIAVVTAGDVVGEISALYGGPRTATVIAREPMEVVGVAPSVLRAMAREFPAFRESLVESVRDRMTESLPHIATSLRRLSDEARRAVVDACEFVELVEGAELFVEGELSPALYLIAAGEAECFGGELGVSRAVRARVGEMVGAASVITATPCGVSARAARTLLVAKIPRAKARELMKAVPSLADLLDDVAAPGRGIVC